MHIQFSRKNKKQNWALALYCFGLKRPTAHSRTRPSRALTRAQATTWAWAGKVASRPRPPRPKSGPVALRCWIASDDRPTVSPEQKCDGSGSPQTLVSFPSPASLSSLSLSPLCRIGVSGDDHGGRRRREESSHRSMSSSSPSSSSFLFAVLLLFLSATTPFFSLQRSLSE